MWAKITLEEIYPTNCSPFVQQLWARQLLVLIDIVCSLSCKLHAWGFPHPKEIWLQSGYDLCCWTFCSRYQCMFHQFFLKQQEPWRELVHWQHWVLCCERGACMKAVASFLTVDKYLPWLRNLNHNLLGKCIPDIFAIFYQASKQYNKSGKQSCGLFLHYYLRTHFTEWHIA